MAKVGKPKITPQERLTKALEGLAPFEAELHLLLPAQIWPYVETLCRLLLSADNKESRDLVAQLALTCRQEALRKFGHDTLETFALARMLREGTSRWQPKQPVKDSITHINSYPHKPHRFTSQQEDAAHQIREVWEAFGKFLDIAGRGIGGGGSARGQALSPVDVMGDSMWEHHRDVFKPWLNKAARTVVERRTSAGMHLTIAAVVFKVLKEDIYPEDLDTQFALIKGTTLKALKAGLDAYYAPAKLDLWGKPPPKAPNAGLQGGQGGQNHAGGSQGSQDPAQAAPAPARGLWVTPRPKLAPGEKVKLGPRKKKQ